MNQTQRIALAAMLDVEARLRDLPQDQPRLSSLLTRQAYDLYGLIEAEAQGQDGTVACLLGADRGIALIRCESGVWRQLGAELPTWALLLLAGAPLAGAGLALGLDGDDRLAICQPESAIPARLRCLLDKADQRGRPAWSQAAEAAWGASRWDLEGRVLLALGAPWGHPEASAEWPGLWGYLMDSSDRSTWRRDICHPAAGQNWGLL